MGVRAAFLAAVSAALLLAAAPAQALAPPEVFLRDLDAAGNPASGWVPANGAVMRSVSMYGIGVRLQATARPGNEQRHVVVVTASPDGAPDQSKVFRLCFPVTGTPGTIVALEDQSVIYEGNGAYALSVTASTGTDASSACQSGLTTTAGFTVAPAVTTARFYGLLLLIDPLGRDLSQGVSTTVPLGTNEVEVVCAQRSTVRPDGSLAGAPLTRGDTFGGGIRNGVANLGLDRLFRRAPPGNYRCVAHARGTTGSAATAWAPWSAPTAARDVKTGFFDFAIGASRLLDVRGPVYRLRTRVYTRESAGTVLALRFHVRGRRGGQRLRVRIPRSGIIDVRLRGPMVPPGAAVGVSLSTRFPGNRRVAPRPEHAALGFVIEGGFDQPATIRFPEPCAPRRC
jgi:hypothetical protein